MSNVSAGEIYKSMVTYTQEVRAKAEQAAKEIQKEMKAKLLNGETTPKRAYPTKAHDTGVVMEITRNRIGNTPAVHTKKKDSCQPGMMRKGWVVKDLKIKDNSIIYGVRNKNMPTVVHLVNFDHELITHGAVRGTVHGTGFVDEVSEWGRNELDRELDEFLERGEENG